MQRRTPDLEELVQPLADEPYSGEFPRGSYMETRRKVRKA